MESIGGYRIIRRLGSGSRADVFLGHAGQGPDGRPELAAVKVFRDRAPEEGIDSEITALSRLSHSHIVRLLDLATGPRDVPSLILQRLDPNGLVRLLADRGTLDAGEAVTILAPLVAAAGAMHRAGVTHGRLGPAAVLFDSTGAPVLCGFGAAGVIANGDGRSVTPAQLDADPAVAADLDALTALVASVLSRVRDPRARADDLARWAAEQPRNAGYAERLERSLFALADAAPVGFIPEAPPRAVPHRFGSATAAPGEVASPSRVLVSGWLAHHAQKIPDWFLDRLTQRLAGVADAIRQVRKRVWVVAGIGIVAVIVAVGVAQLPGAEADDHAAQSDDRIPVQPVAPSAAAGDDPIAAALALLERRAQCLGERSILCLDAVHQAGSAAWHADTARIQALQGGGEFGENPFTAGEATIIDRMGDTVLVALGSSSVALPGDATASVLMIRTEAGWRIRNLLDGSVPLGGPSGL